MGDLFPPSERQMARIPPDFCYRAKRRVWTDRRVVSGVAYAIRNGPQLKDAPRDYGPHKRLYNRFMRWNRLGVFDCIFAGLAGEEPKPERVAIDATHLKVHRTAASLSTWFRKELEAGGIEPCIPSNRSRKVPYTCDTTLCRPCHKVENLLAKLKDWRRIAPSYD